MSGASGTTVNKRCRRQAPFRINNHYFLRNFFEKAVTGHVWMFSYIAIMQNLPTNLYDPHTACK